MDAHERERALPSPGAAANGTVRWARGVSWVSALHRVGVPEFPGLGGRVRVRDEGCWAPRKVQTIRTLSPYYFW